MGQYVHILLDNSTYLAVKSKVKNLSKTGNELFKNFVELENVPDIEEVEILKEMEDIKLKLKAYNERLSILTVHLTKAREERDAELKRKEQEGNAMADAMRMNNPLRYAKLGGKDV